MSLTSNMYDVNNYSRDLQATIGQGNYTLNNSNQTGITDTGENAGVPKFITDLPDYYDLSVIPASSVGAHMNASTTAYNTSIDIDLTDKLSSDYNLDDCLLSSDNTIYI